MLMPGAKAAGGLAITQELLLPVLLLMCFMALTSLPIQLCVPVSLLASNMVQDMYSTASKQLSAATPKHYQGDLAPEFQTDQTSGSSVPFWMNASLDTLTSPTLALSDAPASSSCCSTLSLRLKTPWLYHSTSNSRLQRI